MNSPTPTGRGRNQSLQRAVAILRALAEYREGARIIDIAARADLPAATTRRLLLTLADAGLVDQVEDGRWVIGHELLRLGRAADPYVAVVARARPLMEALMAETRESVLLGVNHLPYGVDVIAQIDPARMVGIGNWLGREVSFHASAGTRCALAAFTDDEVRAMMGPGPFPAFTPTTISTPDALIDEVRRVRESGISLGIDELEEGMTTIAVPVGTIDREHPFTLAISGPTFRLDVERIDELIPRLRTTAAAIDAAVRR